MHSGLQCFAYLVSLDGVGGVEPAWNAITRPLVSPAREKQTSPKIEQEYMHTDQLDNLPNQV